jgi:hypothetical protein
LGRLCLESNPDVAYGVELQSVSPTSSELPSLSLGAHRPRMNRPHTATSRFGRRTVSRCSHPRSRAYSLSPLESRAPVRCASHYFQVWPSNVVSELLSHVIEFLRLRSGRSSWLPQHVAALVPRHNEPPISHRRSLPRPRMWSEPFASCRINPRSLDSSDSRLERLRGRPADDGVRRAN